MAKKTCHLVTLGCRVNQYETQLVKETLFRSGFREARDGETADLCVVNTCTVTATGDSKSRQVIRALARNHPRTRTVVMGCYATRDPDTVAELPNVCEVVTDKRELPDVLDRMGISSLSTGISDFDGRRRATVKVQDGCVLNCSYCIIPQVRPHLSSRPPGEIEAEVRRLIGNGYREIVISGIHVGHYGVETSRGETSLPRYRLSDLLRRLDRIPGEWRMRLSSIEAAEISDDFLRAAAECEHLCPHFHPALQSGADSVLHRMQRRHSVHEFLDTINRMRERLDRPAFTTDVIVGFPGETDAEFDQTLDVCRQVGFLKIHIFPFSARKGTRAAEFPDQIPAMVKKQRCRQLAHLERQLANEYYTSLIGQELEVLVERQSKERPAWLRGTDRRYVSIELPGDSNDLGRFVTAVGSTAHADFLEARRDEVQDGATPNRIITHATSRTG